MPATTSAASWPKAAEAPQDYEQAGAWVGPPRMVSAKLRYFSRKAPLDEMVTGDLAVMMGDVPGLSKEDYKARRHQITENPEVTFEDARLAEAGLMGSWDLDENGFSFIPAPEPVEDFTDTKILKEKYFPRLLETALRAVPGATQAFVLSHVRRTESPANFTGGYAGFSHIDFSGVHVPNWRRLVQHPRYGVPAAVAEEADILALNIWHPYDRPAYKNPLCLVDARSVDMEQDTVKYAYIGNPTQERKKGKSLLEEIAPITGPEVYQLGLCHSPAHRWVYCSDMQTDEAVIFKQWDTRPGVAKCAFHGSFYDPFHDTWDACPGRRSLEARILMVIPRSGDIRADCGFSKL